MWCAVPSMPGTFSVVMQIRAVESGRAYTTLCPAAAEPLRPPCRGSRNAHTAATLCCRFTDWSYLFVGIEAGSGRRGRRGGARRASICSVGKFTLFTMEPVSRKLRTVRAACDSHGHVAAWGGDVMGRPALWDVPPHVVALGPLPALSSVLLAHTCFTHGVH